MRHLLFAPMAAPDVSVPSTIGRRDMLPAALLLLASLGLGPVYLRRGGR